MAVPHPTALAIISTVGITVLAVLLPAGVVLALLAASRWGHTRRFQMASACAFVLLASWNLGSAGFRLISGDIGALFAIELVLAIGFALQGWWMWKAKL